MLAHAGVEIGPLHYVGVENERLRDRTYCVECGKTVDTTLRLAMVSAGYADAYASLWRKMCPAGCKPCASLCLQRFGALILQGPPKTGKTSLLQLLYTGARKSGSFSKVLYVNLAQAQGDLDKALARHQTSWQQLLALQDEGTPSPA